MLLLCVLLAAAVDVSVTVSSGPKGERIRPNFVGFSIEVGTAPVIMGKYPGPIRGSYVVLWNNLRQTPGSEGPRARIGGNSADESWWNPDGKPNPPGIGYSIKPDDLRTISRFLDAVNSTAILGLCMREKDNGTFAANHVRGIASTINWHRIAGVEIGNENDLFGENGIRTAPYTYDDYVTDFDIYAKAIVEAGLPTRTIQGATWCCKSPFYNNFPQYMAKEKALLRTASFHHYSGSTCNGGHATIPALLSNQGTYGVAAEMARWAKAAQALDIEMWMGETNSVSCGGQAGVSDTFAATLWATDYMLGLANASVVGLNFHGGTGGAYAPITYDSATAPPIVRPLYYAMLLVSQVTANYARIVPVTITSTDTLVRAWAIEQENNVNIVIIHKNYEGTPAAVTITPARATASASGVVSRVIASSVTAKDGIKMAGQTFDGTVDGSIQGVKTTEAATADAKGRFTVQVTPGSIAVLTYAL